MKRLTADRAEIGLQIIANNLVGVELSSPKRGEADYSVDGAVPTVSGRRFHGLFLSLRKRNGDAPIQTLIVPAGEYQPGKRLQMSIANVDAADCLRSPARTAARLDLGDRRVARAGRDAGITRRFLNSPADAGRSLPRSLRAAPVERSRRISISPQRCAGAMPRIRSRVAIHWEDEDGARATLTYHALQQQADRLSNALAALGIDAATRLRSSCRSGRRPRSRTSRAISSARSPCRCRSCSAPMPSNTASTILKRRSSSSTPRRCQTSPRSATDCRICVMSSASPARASRGRWTWEVAPGEGVRRDSRPCRHGAIDPALLVYTSGTTGPPKGALMPQQCLLGQPAGIRAFARRIPAARRRLLVAGRLGLDGRAHGRVAADACTSAVLSSAFAGASNRNARCG